jgi:hypothetical protein
MKNYPLTIHGFILDRRAKGSPKGGVLGIHIFKQSNGRYRAAIGGEKYYYEITQISKYMMRFHVMSSFRKWKPRFRKTVKNWLGNRLNKPDSHLAIIKEGMWHFDVMYVKDFKI